MTWLERSRPLKRSKPMARSRIKRGGLPRRVTRPGSGSDPAYLAKVRQLMCRANFIPFPITGHSGDMVAHHAGPKANDSTAVPLCFGHHGDWHDLSGNGVFGGFTKSDRRAWAESAIKDTRRIIREGDEFEAEHTAATTTETR